VTDLHAAYVERGGRLQACPVCVKVRELEGADCVAGAKVTGAPSV
jgi:hypothetical protein